MTEPIRILHVFAKMNRGGAETMLMNLYRNIDRTQIQFDFLVHTEEVGDYDEEIASLGGTIYRIPRYKVYNHLAYSKHWNLFLEKHKEFKIIHGHIRSTASIYLKIAKRFGIKTIIHSHSINSRGTKIERIIKNILQFRIRFISDEFLACSMDAGTWLFGKKIVESDKFNVLKNSISIDQYKFSEEKRKEIRKSLDINNKLVIGHIGSFTFPKNHNYLLSIFQEVLTINSDSLLLLVGEGELKSEIKTKIKTLGLEEKVILTGSVQNVQDYLQAMDVFVFPSHFEGLGMAIIEAQASGLPCFVSDSIPSDAFITSLVKPLSIKQSPKYWAEYITRNNENLDREGFENEVSKSGYNIESTSKWLQEYYHNLLKQRVLFWGMSSNLGGIETYIYNLCKEFYGTDIKIDQLVFDNNICYETEIKELGSEIFRIPKRRSNPLLFYWSLINFFNKNKSYTKIHFFLQSASVIEPVIIAKLSGNKTIVDSRSDYKGTKKITRTLDSVNKKVLPLFTDQMLAISEVSGKAMFGREDFKIIKSAINAHEYRYNPEVRKEYIDKYELNNKILIGHVGRFTYEKNHAFLIEIFKSLIQKIPNVVLMLIGEGELKSEIEDLVYKAGLNDKVIFTGIRSDISNLMMAMDVFIFPSHFEGLGRVVIEAQATGLRTIVSTEVPDEVLITNLVEKVSLKEPIETWLKAIERAVDDKHRFDVYDSIVKSGYDIKSSAMELGEIYTDNNFKE